MRASSMLSVLIISAIFASTHQAQKPNCQPASTTKTYPDTLFVFVVQGGQVHTTRYLLKQFSCAIPNADNIKSYILDFSDETATITIDDTNVYKSSDLATKVATTFRSVLNVMPRCERMEKVQKAFATLPGLSSYTNIKYIAVNEVTACPQLSSVSGWTDVLLKNLDGEQFFMPEPTLAGIVTYSEADASRFLKDETTKLIGKLLGDNSLGKSAAAPSSTDNSDKCPVCDWKSHQPISNFWVGVIVFVCCFSCAVGNFSGFFGNEQYWKNKIRKEKESENKKKNGEAMTPSTEGTIDEKKSKDEKNVQTPSILQNP